MLKVLSQVNKENNVYANKLKTALQDNLKLIEAECGALTLAWLKVINPFHASISGKISLVEAKEVVVDTRKKLASIIKSKKPFDVLQKLQSTLDKENETVFKLINKNWSSLAKDLKGRVNLVVQRGFQDVSKKFEKDVEEIMAIPNNHAKFVALTNRKCESTFGHWKFHQKHIMNLAKDNCADLSLAKQNRLGLFINKLSKEEGWDSRLRALKAKRKNKVAERQAAQQNELKNYLSKKNLN